MNNNLNKCTGQMLRMEIPKSLLYRSVEYYGKKIITIPIYTRTNNLEFDYFYEYKKHEKSQWKLWHEWSLVKKSIDKDLLNLNIITYEKINLFFPADYIFELCEIKNDAISLEEKIYPKATIRQDWKRRMIAKMSVKADDINYFFGVWHDKKEKYLRDKKQYKNNAIFVERKNQILELPKIVKATDNSIFKTEISKLIDDVKNFNFKEKTAFGDFNKMINDFLLKTCDCPAQIGDLILKPMLEIKYFLWNKEKYNSDIITTSLNVLLKYLKEKFNEL